MLPPAELHATNRFGCTAVHWAAAGGDVSVMRWLSERGLDFGVINDAGHGAVQKAAWAGHKAALQWLILDAEGPALAWQLRPVPQLKGGESIDELVRQSEHKDARTWLRAHAITKLSRVASSSARE